MNTALSGISRAGGRKRTAPAPRLNACGRLAARREPVVQLVHEALGADVDAGADAHLLQERHEALVLARVVVGQHLADVARVRQPLALRHAQEQARQPVA